MASNTPEIKKDSRTARSASRAANRPKQTTRQSKRRSKKKPLGKGVAWTIGITLTLVGLCGAALLIGIIGYHGPDKWVKIPSASTSGEVHQSLRDSLGTAEGNRVYLLWKVMGSDAATASGAYLIPHGQSAFTTARKLRNGAQTPVKVTLRGLRLMRPMAERLTAPLECSAEDFLAACDTILPAEGFSPEEFPAAFIPDTYEMYWNSSPSKVVRRLLTYRDRFWNEERRDKASALGLSPVQVATIASIVEEESAKTDEQPLIARLYLNRLHRGMLLQADPTVKFATGDFALRRIKGEHLRTPSPYNTYLNKGLPPGPIRIAQPSTIDGVLNAPVHDFIYMCAKEDFSGYHNFATDYTTHMANARRYQTELNRRNIH